MLARIRRILKRDDGAPADDPEEEGEAAPQGENLLLISDVHLGEACKEHSRIEYLKRGSELDADLCACLDYHARQTPGGRPWRLVFGGDLIDFLQVTTTPEGATDEEKRFGLSTREEDSRWKLRRLMERHRRVFVYLADFIGCGHRVEIVQGNHDAELFWPAVQRTFVEGLVELYFGGEGHHTDLTPDLFAQRITFHPWFFLEPGVLYLEHGHRFDRLCVTPPQLCPLQAGGEDELTQPISGLAIRYFANLERGFKTHDKEHWTVPDYVRYYRGVGLGNLFSLAARYVGFARRTCAYLWRHGRRHNDEAYAAHETRLLEHAERGPTDEDTLRTLDAMTAPSIMAEPAGVFTILAFWEQAGAIAFTATAALVLIAGWPWFVEIPLVLGALAGGVGWSRYNRRRFPGDIKERLEGIAQDIAELVGAPIVCFGHSHGPMRRRMHHDHRSFYVNTGSFLPTERPPHGPDHPCCCPQTFVTILRGGPYDRPKPTLQRWCTVRRAPAPF